MKKKITQDISKRQVSLQQDKAIFLDSGELQTISGKIKIKFEVSYDGTDYCGWQRQNHGTVKSVCQTIQEALEKVFQEKIDLYASGRTDAGVHALAQVCHFETTKPLSFFKNFDLSWAMKAKLPHSITVKDSWIAPPEFHATISASHKTYRYLIYNHPRRSVFLTRYADWVRKPLDIDFLNQISQFLIGEHDFKSFQSVGTPVPHTIRTIYKASWKRKNDHVLEFTVTGSGFLKQMVRNIVGTQLLLERKQEKPEKIKEIIELKDRTKAGPPAPAQGLYLCKVYYPLELDNKCRKL